jgi:hypothetical protein
MGSDLPAVCVACGHETSDTIEVTRSKTEGGQPWPIKVLVFLASPFWFAAMARELQGKDHEVSLVLPFCGGCAAGGKEPRPTFVNFERQELTFIVHDNFATALRGT